MNLIQRHIEAVISLINNGIISLFFFQIAKSTSHFVSVDNAKGVSKCAGKKACTAKVS